jgi:2-oxoglutarate dehydrogenase E2 component (dihydrolipoamide succinyltransferase)
MANFELKMPKLGESITEATITKWLKNVGDTIELDDPILELATDKVDSEIPSPVEGVLKKQLFKEGDVVEVDTVIALIATDGEDEGEDEEKDEDTGTEKKDSKEEDDRKKGEDAGKEEDDSTKEEGEEEKGEDAGEKPKADPKKDVKPAGSRGESGRFYSPLVRNIAREENIPAEELEKIPGSGQDDRLTKADLMDYLKNREAAPKKDESAEVEAGKPAGKSAPAVKKPESTAGEGDEVIEMGRMRKLIAEHMVMSEDTSVHITLFVEADLTNLVNWRNKQKKVMESREGEKLTFTPIFIEAIAKALKDFPMVNVSVDGDKIIKRKHINVGMAAALPDGNLIVPVIRNADHKSLLGLAKEVNDLAARARLNKLKPDEIQGGTFTLTNFGTFGVTLGTPIIYQPQVAILGVGLIQKKPVVIESPEGDSIGIRYMMDLSLGCDHRVVDGALGGMFLRRVADYLEDFDTSQTI